MKPEYRPRRRPEQQIRLALDAMDIREVARHQSGGDQQRHRNKTLMHQERNRFSACMADSIVQVTKAREFLVFCWVPTILLRPQERNPRATQEGSACSQNKACVIMDEGNFRKQVYPRTGSQRDSISAVSDSIRREIAASAVLRNALRGRRGGACLP